MLQTCQSLLNCPKMSQNVQFRHILVRTDLFLSSTIIHLQFLILPWCVIVCAQKVKDTEQLISARNGSKVTQWSGKANVYSFKRAIFSTICKSAFRSLALSFCLISKLDHSTLLYLEGKFESSLTKGSNGRMYSRWDRVKIHSVTSSIPTPSFPPMSDSLLFRTRLKWKKVCCFC